MINMVLASGTVVVYTILIPSVLLDVQRVFRVGRSYPDSNNDSAQIRWLKTNNQFKVESVVVNGLAPASFSVIFFGFN